MEVFLNLTKSATRATLLEQFRGYLDDEQRAAVADTLAHVEIPVDHCHDIGEVLAVIEALPVDDAVKSDMKGIYDILARAEAQVHGCEVEHTHFHEVGNRSGILNALEICLTVAALGEGVHIGASPVQTGSGKVECAHGLMDIPAPATAAILAQGIPVCEEKLEGELCTPTSAAMIKHFVRMFAS